MLPKWLRKMFNSISACIFEEPDKPKQVRELRTQLREAAKYQYAEVWVRYEEYPCICALVNGDRAWLMYLRYNADAGFSSRDPDYGGPADAMMGFYLSNGQYDEYPLAWTIPKKQTFRALEWFAAHGRSPEEITWHNDSGDGAKSPNDKPRKGRGRTPR
jgi:hypothetical protein